MTSVRTKHFIMHECLTLAKYPGGGGGGGGVKHMTMHLCTCKS